MATVSLICSGCGKDFEKSAHEYYRCIRNGQINHFCSLACFGKYGVKVAHLRTTPNYEIKHHAGNRRDSLTPFRYFHKIIRGRAEKVSRKQYDITVDELHELWKQQKGICPFTGWEMNLPTSTAGFVQKRHPKNASLDRINPNEGYVRGNLRFICLIANAAKLEYDDDTLIEFCNAVVQNQL